MNRRHFGAVVATASLAGCAGLFGDDEASRLELTVQNDRSESITAQVVVVGADGTTYADQEERIDTGVARAFEVPVGSDGRHEVTVSGTDWEGTLAWQAETCVRFDGTVRVADERIDVAGECVQQR